MAASEPTETEHTTKPLAELTYDQFGTMFKKLFAESMDENMAKLRQELNDKLGKVNLDECDDKVEEMRIQHNVGMVKRKGELHEV